MKVMVSYEVRVAGGITGAKSVLFLYSSHDILSAFQRTGMLTKCREKSIERVHQALELRCY